MSYDVGHVAGCTRALLPAPELARAPERHSRRRTTPTTSPVAHARTCMRARTTPSTSYDTDNVTRCTRPNLHARTNDTADVVRRRCCRSGSDGPDRAPGPRGLRPRRRGTPSPAARASRPPHGAHRGGRASPGGPPRASRSGRAARRAAGRRAPPAPAAPVPARSARTTHVAVRRQVGFECVEHGLPGGTAFRVRRHRALHRSAAAPRSLPGSPRRPRATTAAAARGSGCSRGSPGRPVHVRGDERRRRVVVDREQSLAAVPHVDLQRR